MQQTSPPATERPRASLFSNWRAWAAHHRHTLSVVSVWALLIIAVQISIQSSGGGYGHLLSSLMGLFRMPAVGPLIFIGMAALCPLLLIPAATMGLVGGVIFGPGLGVLYTLIGCNISGSLAYAAGRLSSGELDEDAGHPGVVRQARELLQGNGLLAVMLLRLSFLPYNPVNYVIGMARVRWSTFIVANTLGSLPGLILIVMAGRSFQHGLRSLTHNPALLLGAAAMVGLIAASTYVARRAGQGSAKAGVKREEPAPQNPL